VLLASSATPDVIKKGIHAGNLVKEIAKSIGGSGGGRPDFGQAGGKDPQKLNDALSLVEKQIQKIISEK